MKDRQTFSNINSGGSDMILALTQWQVDMLARIFSEAKDAQDCQEPVGVFAQIFKGTTEEVPGFFVVRLLDGDKCKKIQEIVVTATEKEKDIIKDVFNLMGASYYFASENKINDVTAVSGSGPAYFLYTIICFIKSAIKLGFSKKEALNLVKDTFKGSYVLANKVGFSVKNLENLIKQVSKKKKFEKIWEQSVMSAFKRAVELSKKYN